MKKRIGILTSGGDCPGLNATIRGVAKACYERFGEDNVEIVGISNGYYGLINNLCKDMSPSAFSGILTQGGTIFGTKRQPFKMMQVIGEDNVDKVKNMKRLIRNEIVVSLLLAETALIKPRSFFQMKDKCNRSSKDYRQ